MLHVLQIVCYKLDQAFCVLKIWEGVGWVGLVGFPLEGLQKYKAKVKKRMAYFFALFLNMVLSVCLVIIVIFLFADSWMHAKQFQV